MADPPLPANPLFLLYTLLLYPSHTAQARPGRPPRLDGGASLPPGRGQVAQDAYPFAQDAPMIRGGRGQTAPSAPERPHERKILDMFKICAPTAPSAQDAPTFAPRSRRAPPGRPQVAPRSRPERGQKTARSGRALAATWPRPGRYLAALWALWVRSGRALGALWPR